MRNDFVELNQRFEYVVNSILQLEKETADQQSKLENSSNSISKGAMVSGTIIQKLEQSIREMEIKIFEKDLSD